MAPPAQAKSLPLAVRLARRLGHPTSSGVMFFQQFLLHPRMIGSCIPTSRASVEALLAPVDWSRARVVVEYGPGVGVFTRVMLEKMAPDARLVAIDTNPAFVTYLRRTVVDDRLHTIRGSADQVEAVLARLGLGPVDYIVSGLPFSTLPAGVGDAIVAASGRALAEDGAMLVYQYSAFVRRLLRRHLRVTDLGHSFRSIPPLRMFQAEKRAPDREA
jgi:phospholipid N-methyltransferase